MSFVRTILNDIAPAAMGLTYSHEHIIIEEGFATLSNPDFILNDTDLITDELKEFYKLGGRTVVDTMPAAGGRNVMKQATVSRQSGVNIIVPTGLHLEIYYPPNHWRYHLSADELAALFIKDITEGIDIYDYNSPIIKRTTYKAGLIKLATGDDAITAHQQKVFEAVVYAHLETGAPILTHTNKGLQAMEQVKLFAKLGAKLDHIVLSHVDKRKDPAYHRDLMQTGVYVEYDSHFRWKQAGENPTYDLLQMLLPNYSERIVIGMDMARNTYWKSYGGKPGLTYLLTTFKEELKKRGMEQYYDTLFLTNPQKLFSFHKK